MIHEVVGHVHRDRMNLLVRVEDVAKEHNKIRILFLENGRDLCFEGLILKRTSGADMEIADNEHVGGHDYLFYSL